VRLAELPLSPVAWRPSHRIIPSRYPTVQLFERVADPADLEAVFMIEALTNDRLREEVGELSRVAPEERISGPGTGFIMSAFTRLNPDGSRFSDGSHGVYYCAADQHTAIAETVHHRQRFLAATAEPPCELDMRVILADLRADLHDLRDLHVLGEPARAFLDPDDYAPGQWLGRELSAANAQGIVYPSVRRAGGECAAVFRPRALSPARTGRHLCYVWDGSRIAEVYEKRPVRWAG
jgi:RES domain-containing protein